MPIQGHDFLVRRKYAIEATTEVTTLQLLERMPRMIAEEAPSGMDEICYRDADIFGPISCSQSEVKILHALGRQMAQKHCLEIGSGIGWSAAAFLWDNPKTTLTTVDAFIEGPGRLLTEPNEQMAMRFQENIDAMGLTDRVTLVREYTDRLFASFNEPLAVLSVPLSDTEAENIWQAVRDWSTGVGRMTAVQRQPVQFEPAPPWDFVFLDGWHMDGQPLKDIDGLRPMLTDTSVIAMHDVWIPDVYEAFRSLLLDGWHAHIFPTPNTLAVLYKQEPAWWRKLIREVSG